MGLFSKLKSKDSTKKSAIIVPEWLIHSVANSEAHFGPDYTQKVFAGYLEIRNWTRHLKNSNGERLEDKLEDLLLFRKKVMDEGMSRKDSDPDNYVLVETGGLASHQSLMVTGKVIEDNLKALGWSQKYFWLPVKD
jgi:hypothetical protein